MVQFNLYVFALILSALTSAVLAFYTFRRGSSAGSRELGQLMLALFFWALTAALEGAFVPFSVKMFWAVVSYLGSQTTPVFLLLFVMHYTRQEKEMGRWGKIALFIVPILSLLMAATNDLHRLLWPSLTLVQAPEVGAVILFAHGPWFWVEVVYAYTLIVISAFYLVGAYYRYPSLVPRLNSLLLLVAGIPWIFNILYVFGDLGVSRVVDLTPVAFSWSFGLLAWAIFRQEFLDIVPVTREQIIENLREGILIVDAQKRVVDANLAFRKTFHLTPTARGQSAAALLAAWPELLVLLASPTEQTRECSLVTVDQNCYELHVRPLFHPKGQYEGALLFINDIHERKRAELALRESEQRYRVLVENQGEGIGVVDAQGNITFANPAAERILGLPSGELAGKSLYSLFTAEQVEQLRKLTLQAGMGPKNTFEFEMVQRDGSPRIIEISATPQYSPDGDYIASFGIFRDVTERKQAENDLRLREAQLRTRERFLSTLNDITRAALEASDLQTMVQTLADRLGTLFNADGCYITQWDEVEKTAIPTAAYGAMRTSYPLTRSEPNERTITASVLEAGRILVAEDVFQSPHLSPRIAANFPSRSILGLPLIAGGRKLGAALVSFNTPHHFSEDELAMGELAATQVSLALFKQHLLHEAHQARALAEAANSQLKLAMNELDELATTDSLTGAYNRNRFDELVYYELNQFDRYGQPLALVMFDIDHFKQVNDTYGHNVGDLVLMAVVKTVKENIRVTDTLTRWGGDEFIILSPGITMEQALQLACKLHEIVNAQAFPGVGHLTISLGVTEAYPGDTADMLLSRVDNALYQAKRNGRNRVEVLT